MSAFSINPANTAPMTDTAAHSAWDELARELLRGNTRGKMPVAIDGVDAAARVHFANSLAYAVRAWGRAAVRLTAQPFTDDDAVLAVVDLFTAGELGGGFEDVPENCMLIVDGWSLLRGSIRHAWQFTVFLDTDVRPDDDAYARHRCYLRADAPCEASDAVYDVTDLNHPLRIRADSW